MYVFGSYGVGHTKLGHTESAILSWAYKVGHTELGIRSLDHTKSAYGVCHTDSVWQTHPTSYGRLRGRPYGVGSYGVWTIRNLPYGVCHTELGIQSWAYWVGHTELCIRSLPYGVVHTELGHTKSAIILSLDHTDSAIIGNVSESVIALSICAA